MTSTSCGASGDAEAAGASIVLDRTLWPVATAEQEKRRIRDPWEDRLENIPPLVEVGSHPTKEVQIIYQADGKELVRVADVLEHIASVPTGHQNAEHGRRLARVMKRHGWQEGRFSFSGVRARGYCRDAPAVDLSAEWKRWCKEKGGGAIGDSKAGVVYVHKDRTIVPKQAKTGFLYAFAAGELFGRAGRPQRFSTHAELGDTVGRWINGIDDGWEWIAPSD